MVHVLTNSNFALFAAKHYENPSWLDEEEFAEDLSRIKYIKRLFNKYRETGELKERLILNHLVILFNVFGTAPGLRMLFLKLQGYESALVPFLVYMGRMPDEISDVVKPGVFLRASDVLMDQKVVGALRTV